MVMKISPGIGPGESGPSNFVPGIGGPLIGVDAPAKSHPSAAPTMIWCPVSVSRMTWGGQLTTQTNRRLLPVISLLPPGPVHTVLQFLPGHEKSPCSVPCLAEAGGKDMSDNNTARFQRT